MSPHAAFARVNLDQLWAPFAVKLFSMVAALNERGATFRATQGHRSFTEQAVLYFQGRTNQSKPKVTNARPGYSAHNFGIACDFVRVLPTGKLSWDERDYGPLGEEAEKAGLAWGGRFHALPDLPHVQLPGYVTGDELATLRAIYLAHMQAPLTAVFDFLNSQERTA